MKSCAAAVAFVCALAGTAHAQSASVVVGASSTSAAPGDTVTITVSVDYDLAGAGSGVFGAPGFYGFGGDVDGSGTAAATAAVPTLNAALMSGPVATTAIAPGLVTGAAGRGLMGGLADDPATMMSFDLTIDAGATDGQQITLDYDGAVVLVLDDTLTTFSTTPGVNQSPLSTTGVTITVSATPACPGDINTTGTTNGVPDGQTNLSDLQFFLTEWQNDLGMTPGSLADVNTTGTTNGMPDGEVNLSDLQFFLTQWQAGLGVCP